MKKNYFTWEEGAAYGEGRRDAQYGRRDISRQSKMFADFDTPDRAYWEGQEDYLKEQEKRRMSEEYWDDEYERWRQGL